MFDGRSAESPEASSMAPQRASGGSSTFGQGERARRAAARVEGRENASRR